MIVKNISLNKIKQLNFIKLSGDKNKIHNFKFSQNVVAHGVNILLLVLENFPKKYKHYLLLCSNISISFLNPVIVPTKLNFNYKKNNEIVECEVCSTSVHAKFSIQCSLKKLKFLNNKDKPNNRLLNNPKKSNIFSKKKKIKEKFNINNIKLLRETYPNLIKFYGTERLKSIIYSSYFVGMKYPGYNSLLSSLNIFINNSYKKDFLTKLLSIDKRINLSKININSIGAELFIHAFGKNDKIQEPSIYQIKKNYNKNLLNCSAQNALIIGGSKGIGALTSKILGIGKANLYITYKSNRKKLFNIKKEILRINKNIKIYRLDVMNFKKIKKVINNNKINCIYYFATPEILSFKRNKFDNKIYQNFLKYFYFIPKKIINLLSKKKEKIYFFYPSSIFLDDKKKYSNISEYLNAKLKAEKNLNKNFEKTNLIIRRLPPIKTEQNNFFLPIKTHDGIIEVLKFVEQINSKLEKDCS